jgi:two-component system cell cycle sensor histidine kinase/response regulator CckA
MSSYDLSELARTLFEESGDALFLFDADSEQILDVNAMAQRLSGLGREELLQLPAPHLFRCDDPDGFLRLAQAYRQAVPFHSQEGFWLRRRESGSWVPVNLTVTRLRTGNGVLGLITARDISERRRHEEALRASEAKCRSLLENLEQSIFLKDTSLRFIAANRRFCEAVGLSEAEILGKTDFDFYPSELAEKYRADDRRILNEGRRLELEEKNLFQGQLRRVRVIKTPVRDDQERIAGVLGIFWDVTEQHALEEQLRQAQKMEAVGQLAGGVAHDFNNLLTAILGNLSLLQSGMARTDSHRSLVEAIERAAWRAATLTRQLLGFSRRTLLHPESLNANNTVNEVVGLLKRTIDPRILLQTHTASDLWLVQADPNQMSQVLMNLCLNARDAVQPLFDDSLTRPLQQSTSENHFAGGSGETLIDCTQRTAIILLETANVVLGAEDLHENMQARPGEFVRLRVCDNGTGIAAEAQEHIFEPFFTTKGPDKGTGLGLAMVFGIVQQHRGWIECHSVPRQGTRFDIYLPRHCSAAAPSAVRSQAGKPRGGSETILVVDDEALVRNLGRSILEQFGYTVLSANDGQEGIGIYRHDPARIDLIVLDLTMPRVSGRDALHQLLAINPGVRVLIASGHGAEHLSAEDHQHICGFVSKPYRPDDLALAVRTALDRPRVPSFPPEHFATPG